MMGAPRLVFQKAFAMGLQRVSIFLLGALLVAGAGPAISDEYRAGEFLGLDLSKALLSPKLLGPQTQFAPVAVEARSDAARVRAEPKGERKVVVRTTKVRTTKIAAAKTAKPRVAARTKLARRHSNPLDAQAMDTRVQVWPCRSGGICNWKR
jgi:hypothetical protein